MSNLKFRAHGRFPYSVAVLHGGPGAAGEMAPVARELASSWGVLEPIQTCLSVDGQVAELKDVLQAQASGPVILIGFSWGAWLGFILTARYPGLVKKLILVASAPFEGRYVAGMQETRLSRLTVDERAEIRDLSANLTDPAERDKQLIFARFGALLTKADAFDPDSESPDALDFDTDIFQKVWPEADQLRQSGRLLGMGRNVICPVVAIHGDYDSHPAEGVRTPLAAVLNNFRFILLENCGHRPWLERQAKAGFFEILMKELADQAC